MFTQSVTFFVSLVALTSAGQQAVSVEGMVTCNGSPYKDAKIKIYELDTLHDDELARTFSNADGKFRLGGSQSELGGISTQLNIYHKCEMPFYKRVLPMCYYKATFPIPTRYVKSGSVSEPYNVQTIELSLHAKGYDCINRRR